ncbi:MAG: toxic anion resistance protein [Pseudomonadota bacterium]
MTTPAPTHLPATLSSTDVSVLAPQQLEALGLEASDQADVLALADGLDWSQRDALMRFGRDAAQKSAHYADQMLSQVRSNDVEGLGGKLTEIVASAQSLNLHALGEKKSRVPLLGGLIDRVRQSKDELVNQFSSVKSNIERLMDEVSAMQAGLQARIASLDEGFGAVKTEYRQLGLHIAAAQMAQHRLRQAVTEGQEKSRLGQLTALQSQTLHDQIAGEGLLDKRIADMRMLQHSALQTLPMIRLVQTNNSLLIEKFHTIKELTLPAWKRQFMLALSLSEQRNAVHLAKTIDDATNAFLKENAQLLKQNTIGTAQSNQRMVIDIATLQDVQNTLLSTVQEVIKINQEGAKQRAGVADQLGHMREQMRLQLAQNQ